MTEEEFWQYISSINALTPPDFLEGDCDVEGILYLAKKLSVLSVSEIEQFHDILSKKLYDLDGKKYADNAGLSGGSGDGFLYARCWVVAQGKPHYLSVLENPKNMTDDEEEWCEALLHVAHEAWGLKNAKDPMEWDYIAKYDYESFSNQALWK